MAAFTSVLRATCLCGLLASAAASAQEKPYFAILGESTRPLEGNAGNNIVQIEWTFSSAPTSEVRFTVRTDESVAPSATPGVDYVVIPPTEFVIPAGQQRGSTALTIVGDTVVEPTEMLFMKYYNFRGGATARPGSDSTAVYDVGVLIMNDDTPPAPPLISNNDHFVFYLNEGTLIYPGRNDLHDPWNVVRDTEMTVIEPPLLGALVQMDYGVGIDYFRYEPAQDSLLPDRFRYRLCKSGGGECVEANVYLSGALKSPSTGVGGGRSSGTLLDFTGMPDIADARYSPSTLAQAKRVSFNTGVDATPNRAWDSGDGTAWSLGTLSPAPDGQVTEYRIVVNSAARLDEKVDLRIGVDTNGDGRPSAEEQACISVGVYGVLVACDVTIPVGNSPVAYWVHVHSREPTPWASAFNLFQLKMDDASSLMDVSGPVTIERGDSMLVMATWVDPSALGPLLAFVRIRDGERWVGDFRLETHGGEGVLMLPTDSSPVTVSLMPTSQKWWPDRQMFFDVAPGTKSITITASSDQAVDVAPFWYGFEGRRITAVREAYSEPASSAYVRVPGGQSRSVTVASPAAGRWYAFVRNTVDQPARVEIKVNVDSVMPTILPGSYFNPNQAGHGLVLYPAGSQWAGLWYTYDSRSRPTWYYVQAAQPGSDGVWRAPVYRVTWDGRESRNTQVGRMQITPLSDRRFFMSYVVDAGAGSLVMEALGSGCPPQDGAPLDISSHWFDPARAGHGYSVQTWPSGYQFVAAFTYDKQGYPLYLSAERPDLGGSEAQMALEYLQGPCPGCDYRTPTRFPAGTLRRTLSQGRLSSISLDVDYQMLAPLEGRRVFSVTDRLQLLGGPGSTQGCSR